MHPSILLWAAMIILCVMPCASRPTQAATVVGIRTVHQAQ